MKKNTLWLLSMGMKNDDLNDIKNHRVRVVENIDIERNGKAYNMFFEFTQWEVWRMRYTNKRTGAPLKKPIQEIINPMGLHIDTEYETVETSYYYDGKQRKEYTYNSSWRCRDLEKEFYNDNLTFCKADILKAVNRYATKKFTRVCIIEQEIPRIVEKIGGFREKNIISGDWVAYTQKTWNDDHKIVEVYDRTTKTSFDLDLVTNTITG